MSYNTADDRSNYMDNINYMDRCGIVNDMLERHPFDHIWDILTDKARGNITNYFLTKKISYTIEPLGGGNG